MDISLQVLVGSLVRRGIVTVEDLAAVSVDEVSALSELHQLRAAARLDVTDRLKADALDQATIEAVAGIYDPWEPGLAVTVGQVLRWDGTLVEVLQAHTTQADWTPDVVPALFRVYRTDDGSGPIEWIAGVAVTAGEQVIYQGVTYNVLQSHTTQVGWEPPNVPALYAPA